MQRVSIPVLTICAITSAYWGYSVISSLIREYSMEITYIDLGVIFILGLITGITIGMAIIIRWNGLYIVK